MNQQIWIGSESLQVGLSWSGEGSLEGIELRGGPKARRTTSGWIGAPVSIRRIAEGIEKYLASGSPLEVEPVSGEGTEFQKKVYRAISRIPHGETRTYGWVAKKIGKPHAARAVGQALRRNRFPILIPCHRVVGTQGLGGFMGSAESTLTLDIKKALLALERKTRN